MSFFLMSFSPLSHLATVSLMDPVKLREQPVKSAPGKKRKEREEAEAKAKNEATEVKAEETPQAEAKEENILGDEKK